MKNCIKYLAVCFAIFLISSVAYAKPNYTYSVQKNKIPNVNTATSISGNYLKKSSEKNINDVLKGSVEVKITPYCKDWTSSQAFNVINHIGLKLMTTNGIDGDVHFVVSENEEANASTDLKNRISVYKGLLEYVETEDELAFVIGHEMGHVTKSHVKKSVFRRSLTSTAAVTGTVLNVIGLLNDSSGLVKTGTILLGSSAAGELVNKKISRGQETKSDKLSIDYMVNAGYNPLASISILNKISGNYFDFFSDHPSGEKRIKNAYKYIKKTYPEYIEQGYPTKSYQKALEIIEK